MLIVDNSGKTIMYFIGGLLFSFLLVLTSCSSSKKITETVNENSVDLPVITFDQQTLDLGDLVEGESRSMVFNFTNTGSKTLQIDLATACKCTDLRWTQDPIPPGGKGTVEVEFDSTDFNGEVKKTIDIIANTEPLVTEAFFTATIVKKL